MQITAFPTKYVGAFESGVPCEAGVMLRTPFDTDAHFVAYTSALGCRLAMRLFEYPDDKIAAVDARMTAAVFDIDDPATHPAGEPAREAWWIEEKVKLARLGGDLFAYRTRGGYRILGALAEPHALRSREDAERWRAGYLTWCAHLERRFEIRSDRACADWTRFYRAPNVVRDGVRQEFESIGDPDRIGTWAPALEADDRVRPKKVTPHYGTVEPVPISDPTNAYGRARIRAAVEYLQRAPLSIKGQTGRNTMFQVCAVLVRRMRLPLDVAAELIEAVYNPRLAAAGTDTWSLETPSRHGMSIFERLEKARDTGSVPPGNVFDESTWHRLGGVL